MKEKPHISWEWGTAYDLFISLAALHKPNKFGVRGAWAKGVRSRLPAEEREFLEQTASFFVEPLHWVHKLPQPCDGQAMLRALAEMPAAKRLYLLMYADMLPEKMFDVLKEVSARGQWGTQDRETLWALTKDEKYAPSEKMLTRMLDWWSAPNEFGERYLTSMKAYYEVFFAEEEARIRPALAAAQERAQELAEKMPFLELLEELSQGIRFETPPKADKIVMAPSFWVSPLIIMVHIESSKDLFLYGARPADASLVPGEVVPDALFRGLKALADPTRLRIMRYLAKEFLTPTELARRLRLRAPTVIHHLNTLRLAGLVYLTFEAKGDKRYAARMSRVGETCAQLQDFLGRDIGMDKYGNKI